MFKQLEVAKLQQEIIRKVGAEQKLQILSPPPSFLKWSAQWWMSRSISSLVSRVDITQSYCNWCWSSSMFIVAGKIIPSVNFKHYFINNHQLRRDPPAAQILFNFMRSYYWRLIKSLQMVEVWKYSNQIFRKSTTCLLIHDSYFLQEVCFCKRI